MTIETLDLVESHIQKHQWLIESSHECLARLLGLYRKDAVLTNVIHPISEISVGQVVMRHGRENPIKSEPFSLRSNLNQTLEMFDSLTDDERDAFLAKLKEAIA